MAEKLTVAEASAAYESAMRNMAPPGPTVCPTCHAFIAPHYNVCRPCSQQPDELDAVVPITYSENRGPLHHALRMYKDGPQEEVRRYAIVRLTAVLWRFLEAHEGCLASHVGVSSFDLVTTVPSSTSDADDRRDRLRTMVGWCRPVAPRLDRVLRATANAEAGHHYDAGRYTTVKSIAGSDVLLIDDTWTTGGHAQSAAHALHRAGASRIGLVVIGRHVRPEWEPTPGETCADRLAALPRIFDWGLCAVH